MTGNPLLSTRKLSVDIRGKRILDNCSLDINSGEVLSFLGPNGAGKSSFLKAIAGDLSADGEISVGNRRLNDISSAERARAISVMPQRSSLRFAFSVREVLAMGRIPHSTGNKVDALIVSEVAEAMDLAGFMDKPYTQLSGGEQQRVQFARALVQVWRSADSDYRLILLDEPTSSLDLKHQIRALKVLKELAASGVAVVAVLHDINLALHYSDRTALFANGQLVEAGASEEVINAKRLSSLFHVELEMHQSAGTGRPSLVPL